MFFPSVVLPAFACAALLCFAAEASDLPPLRCTMVGAPGATCAWTMDRPGCTWEEGGTPTVCTPLAGAGIALRTAGTYRGGYNNAAAANSVAYDGKTHRLFVANGATQTIDVVDLGGGAVDADRPRRLAKVCSIPVADPERLSSPGGYTPVHLAFGKDGLLAVVLQQREDVTRRGKIALLDARGNCNAPPLKVIDVGFMPARAAFTPNGRSLLVSNEGEPSQDYRTDPPGSVSIIDLGRGVARTSETAEVTFAPFDPLKQSLIARGVRISGPDLSSSDPRATTSVEKDLEPEGIAISADSRFAWITLPENNAVATLDIRRSVFVAIRPFGAKDHGKAGNGLDPTDNDGPPPHIRTWPIRGMYMPKQVAIAAPAGAPVLVYPNRGVRRRYAAYADEVRLSDLPRVEGPIVLDLDPTVFPPDDPATAALRHLRLKVSRVDGDEKRDGRLRQVYAFGGRSFSIRGPDNGLVFDSGDDFERITAQAWRDTGGTFLFNTPDDENRFDGDSDLRGPEPVAVATGRIGLRTYAFIGLERVGGVMTYDITNPFKPTFQHYIDNRNFHLNPKDGAGVCAKRRPETGECANVGDQSAEELLFIAADESPTGTPLLVVGNTTSGSATLLRIDQTGDRRQRR
jgi:DNA-binding beta-propeller fold protein YncE